MSAIGRTENGTVMEVSSLPADGFKTAFQFDLRKQQNTDMKTDMKDDTVPT